MDIVLVHALRKTKGKWNTHVEHVVCSKSKNGNKKKMGRSRRRAALQQSRVSFHCKRKMKRRKEGNCNMTSKESLHLSELFRIGFDWKFIGEPVILIEGCIKADWLFKIANWLIFKMRNWLNITPGSKGLFLSSWCNLKLSAGSEDSVMVWVTEQWWSNCWSFCS